MPIRSIEIMCIPCAKCELAKRLITDAIKLIELQNKVKIVCAIKHTPNLIQAAQYSVNASQAPIIIINGNVALAGQVTHDVVKKKLEAIHKY